MKLIKIIIIALASSLILTGCLSSPSKNGSAHTGQAREWYKSLRPGISRAEVIALAGEPSSVSEDCDAYDAREGRFELKYQDSILVDCTYYRFHPYNRGTGVRRYYWVFGGELTEEHMRERHAYLESGEYAVLPEWDRDGLRIFTRFCDGACYKVGDSYLAIDRMLSIRTHDCYYRDKAAKVSLIDSLGKVTVLYRAMDNWERLRPPTLSGSLLNSRTENLLSLGNDVIGMPFHEVLGAEDSRMGSGRDLRVFYLKDGLAIAEIEHANLSNSRLLIASIKIQRPGEIDLTLEDWIKEAQPPLTPNMGKRKKG